MASEKELLGRIVAFEGHAEIISTQLRLLPTSPQILILPSIQYYMSNDDSLDEFRAHKFIKKVHEAVEARNQAALDFLGGSTSDVRRLVFLNGGTPSVQAVCLKAIMKHETDGDHLRAESILNLLIKDGIVGLCNPDEGLTGETIRDHPCDFEDPVTRAMRAADALDRQTASLQPINELDLNISSHHRSNSLPLYGYADSFGDAAPFFVFGAPEDEYVESISEEADEDLYTPRNPRLSIMRQSESFHPGFSTLQAPTPEPQASKAPSCAGESCASLLLLSTSPLGPEVFTPRSDVFSIRSTDNVVYGEASILDMRLSGRKATLKRVKSLDRKYAAAPKYRDLCLPSRSEERERAASPEERRHFYRPISTADGDILHGPVDSEQPAYRDNRRHSCMMLPNTKDPVQSHLSYIEGPKTIVVRSSRPTVRIAPVPTEKKRKPARASYSDRGTDADDLSQPRETHKPVFTFCEDLVVHFRDETPDTLLCSVIEEFKAGVCPILTRSPTLSETDETGFPCTPKAQSIDEVACKGFDFGFRDPNVMFHVSNTDEYDPFAYVQPTSPALKQPQKLPVLKVQRPPTPFQALPSPTIWEGAAKIQEFEVNNQQTAVVIQNSLRSLLQDYFPLEFQGYRQFQFPLLPELDALWRPIFREAGSESTQGDSPRMDQILAIGAQRGVKRDYASAITGQLEKLGTKASGLSRSGRLDFRYLLANAMQAFTAQPLTSQTHDNPFNNSYLLATLIVPHLETYLALHSEVRFLLLEYPPEHLSTMVALQKLVGVDLMKVAQIFDAKSEDRLPFTHLSGSLKSPYSDQGTPSRYGPSGGSSMGTAHDFTLTKANFLLTSTASQAEIATFLSTIRQILSEVSGFYAPEEAPKKPSNKKPRPAPIQGTFSPFPRVVSNPQSPPLSPALTARFGMGPPSPRASSIAETFKSSRSTKVNLKDHKSKADLQGMDTLSVLTMDLSDDDWDMEDQRIMPMLTKKPHLEKGNSRKALKMLGLA